MRSPNSHPTLGEIAVNGQRIKAVRKLFNVLDKPSGKILRVMELDGMSAAAPMTYTHEGRQYVAVAVGGGAQSELVAFAIPPR